jgi:hypothetical protein
MSCSARPMIGSPRGSRRPISKRQKRWSKVCGSQMNDHPRREQQAAWCDLWLEETRAPPTARLRVRSIPARSPLYLPGRSLAVKRGVSRDRSKPKRHSRGWPGPSARPAQYAEHRSWVFAVAAADPGDIEAEGLGADVKFVRRGEEHLLLRNAEHRHDGRETREMGLVSSDAVDAGWLIAGSTSFCSISGCRSRGFRGSALFIEGGVVTGDR